MHATRGRHDQVRALQPEAFDQHPDAGRGCLDPPQTGAQLKKRPIFAERNVPQDIRTLEELVPLGTARAETWPICRSVVIGGVAWGWEHIWPVDHLNALPIDVRDPLHVRCFKRGRDHHHHAICLIRLRQQS
ncbi:MAG: hypothetical protein C4346_18190 [Chloroflexota bacterium]